jgi:polyhydroxyalkanoate synthase
LKSGIQTFCVSWRNPTAEQRDWGLDTYVAALDEAVDAVRDITSIDDVSMMGSCSGGITASAYLGTLAARNERKVRNIVLAVCVLDTATTGDSAFGSLVTPETMRAAKEASRLRGVLDGHDLARMFAWMRPNDLIWNYWVNNYLLGKEPPAFDILFWNADTTCLPARLHSDYIDLYFTNPFVNSKKLSLNGTATDMERVNVDSYVIAGVTDHITPWKSVYQTAKIMGKDTTFILSNSGHLQSLLNPPGNPKAAFVTGPLEQAGPEAFLAASKKYEGSWWLNWRDWLYERSDDEVPAPAALGNARYRAEVPAPGTYVFDQ